MGPSAELLVRLGPQRANQSDITSPFYGFDSGCERASRQFAQEVERHSGRKLAKLPGERQKGATPIWPLVKRPQMGARPPNIGPAGRPLNSSGQFACSRAKTGAQELVASGRQIAPSAWLAWPPRPLIESYDF